MNNIYECITSFQYGIEVGDRKELVRCKNCKHQYHMTKDGDVICGHVSHESETHKADWFCADGEKRE